MICVHHDWGVKGVKYALKKKHLVIIVDVIRFSSAVVTAVASGFTVYPVPDLEKGRRLADKTGAELAGKAGEARYSLSPLSYLENTRRGNKKVVLPSPNGATCATMLKNDNSGYIGCFLNAAGVARQAQKTAEETGRDITVVAAGEERAVEKDGFIYYIRDSPERVFAVEDYLGSGAIISYMNCDKDPDARLCERAYEAVKNIMTDLLFESYSGRWLLQNNARKDLEHLIQMNYYDVVPEINDGKISEIKRNLH
ncbi:MAG: 2-phosphosulfolactate phosphatase [candidate division Zixibacteria bacterium]|nr:2-phosphosulfolactate phosphatase [candidate division Zixibacteria bacterium]MDD5427408.1 2-phosphosulfolactate phosphatase [candidate division Zixibacteria bacterium]